MRSLLSFLLSIGGSTALLAQLQDIRVTNWTVPPYAAPSADSGFTAITGSAGFDIASAAGGGLGTPAPRAFIPLPPCRVVDTRLASFPAGYGPPALSPGSARSFDLRNGPCPGIPQFLDAYSLNVTVVTPAGPGHLIIWPDGASEPSASSINYAAGQTIANAVIVRSGQNGRVLVKAGVSGTHLLIDINGFFAYSTPTNESFLVQNTSPGAGVAIVGTVPQGGNNSAGVFGVHGNFQPSLTWAGAGVRGQGQGYGVLGISSFEGVTGSLLSGSTELAYGILGSSSGVDTAGPPWGVFAGGNIGATGTKHFLDPHPTDPNVSIAYVSLEGPEAGTYFRGRGKFQNGLARIEVPEHFRLVTDPEGLTVQITPIGGMASFAVMKADLNEIIVQSSRNVEFYYFVHGVRAAFKDLTPLRRAGDFMPRSADAKMPEWLSRAQKQRLIQNGTYREDGTVNVETARRLGWDRVWEKRSRPVPVSE